MRNVHIAPQDNHGPTTIIKGRNDFQRGILASLEVSDSHVLGQNDTVQFINPANDAAALSVKISYRSVWRLRWDLNPRPLA